MDPMKAQQLAAELEVEMMADMYNRMTSACHRKCVPPHYKEAELTKGRRGDEEGGHGERIEAPMSRGPWRGTTGGHLPDSLGVAFSLSRLTSEEKDRDSDQNLSLMLRTQMLD
ncbi:mitochondrial import inner membrane translocase subunit Tim10 isoform X1 [Brachionichthys hirsutus]|uniref:mitochondrial import inner membrane translocase subunit Tim10 isoform X1 n=1 Tax=Brachionichthys hirsutus TaxID=412623 RepID=UPI0036045C4B